jgi:Rieske Fe-S protein
MSERSMSVSNTGRRRFLRWATAVSAVGAAVLPGLSSLRAFCSPTFEKPEGKRWVKLGEADLFDLDLPPTKVDFSETVNDAWVEKRVLRSVWVYTEDGEKFTVYNAHCTHLGCIVFYDKDKRVLHSPCHHGLFDVKEGTVLAGPPPRPLDTLEWKVEDGILYCAYQDFRVGIPQKVPV